MSRVTGLPNAVKKSAADISVEEIAKALTEAILQKRLPPGTWLREEALGRVYAVSRTKIRAALLLLSRDRLIQTIPDKGAFVSRPTVKEAREVFTLRRLLESEVVRLFVANATEADYDQLGEHVRLERQRQDATTSSAQREKLLGDFHSALAARCGNGVLAEMVADLVVRSSLIAMLYPSNHDAACGSDEHEDFLRVARSGNVNAAVDNMVTHLQRVESSLHLDTDAPAARPDLLKALLA